MKRRVMLMEHREQPGGETPPTPQENSELTPPETPQTPTPSPSPTDDAHQRYVGILEATLRDQNRQITELQNRQNQPAPTPTPQPVDLEKEKQDFYNDPMGSTRRLLQKELKETIEPLVQTVKSLRFEGSPYDQMMTKLKADPRFSAALQDAQIVSTVNQMMANVELSEPSMIQAVVHAMGLRAMGLLGAVAPSNGGSPAPTPATPAQTPTPQPAGTVLPPHMRPSPPPGPSNTAPRGQSRTFTENERRLMREQGMTEDQYVQWLELPIDQVATANFDKPKPKA